MRATASAQGHSKTVEVMKWMVTNHPEGSDYVPADLDACLAPSAERQQWLQRRAPGGRAQRGAGFGIETHRRSRRARVCARHGVPAAPPTGRESTSVARPRADRRLTAPRSAACGTRSSARAADRWFFASSDLAHLLQLRLRRSRRHPGLYPGSTSATYTMVRNDGDAKLRPQTIVDGLRTGNNFTSSGQLSTASPSWPARRTRPAARAVVEAIAMATTSTSLAAPPWARSSRSGPAPRCRHDRRLHPAGTYAPYSFANPSSCRSA